MKQQIGKEFLEHQYATDIALKRNGRMLTDRSQTLRKIGIQANETLYINAPLLGGSLVKNMLR